MAELRASAEPARNAGERLLGAALALGFYHAGDPKAVREASKDAASKSAKHARRLKAEKPLHREGTLAKEFVQNRTLDIIGRMPELEGSQLA